MAIEDYFKGSSEAYGQLAGSLLAGNKKSSKKQAKRALIASTVMGTFGALQKKQKQDIIDGSNEVKEQYQDIFNNNEEIYNLQASSRSKYFSYLDDKDGYLHREAVKKFNADPFMKKELGENAWSSVNKETLIGDSYTKAVEVFNAFQAEAKENIEAKGLNPASSTATFTKFNELATQEYRAALSAVQDDPTKKGLIREAFNKIFGKDRDGKKRFGLAEKGELMNAVDEIKTRRLNQEEKVNAPLTLKEEEDKKINTTLNVNTNAVKKLAYFKGTNVSLDYDFQTKKEMLKLNKEAFIQKINEKDYLINEDDINSAVEHGYAIPGFKGLTDLMANDREDLVAVALKIKGIKQDGNNPWAKGLLNDNERSLWMIATNMDLNAREKSDLELQKIHRDLVATKVDSPDYTKVLSLRKDVNFTASVNSTVEGLLTEDNYSSIKKLYDNGQVSQTTKDGLTTHIIRGALYLQNLNKGMGMQDAVDKSTKIQMRGFYQFQEDPTRLYNPLSYLSNETHQHQYVNLSIINEMEKDITNDKQAAKIANYMSTKKYIQNENNGEFKPDTIGKSTVDGNYKFTVVNIASPGEEENLIWDYENINP